MFSTEEHWKFFAEFCGWEMKSGGPDPQLAMVNGLQQGKSQAQRLWGLGCYIAVYNVAYAEALWREWLWGEVKLATRKQLLPHLKEHWSKVTTRVERRCVRRPDWMCEFLLGYRLFVWDYAQLQKECKSLTPTAAYEHAWDRALQVPRLGRYVALKLLEYLKRYEGLPVQAPDIRPKGGWSPRRTLATLWEDPEVAVENDRPEVLALVNDYCTETLRRLAGDFGLDLDLFQLQVMLCEYRESWEGERQYPGRSLDSELKYAYKAEHDWGHKSGIWAVRKKLFPHEHLGELQGWDGPREYPAQALAHHKFTWTDLKYDYHEIKKLAPVTKKTKRVKRSTKGVRVYTIIENHLYQSGRWIHLDILACQALVKEYGLTGIANFWKDDPRLGELVSWYKWWPLQDGRRISSEVPFMAEQIVQQLRSGGRILTMCYGGRNRSGLLSALVAQRWCECDGIEAIKLVKSARKGALVNKYFTDYIQASIVVPRVYL